MAAIPHEQEEDDPPSPEEPELHRPSAFRVKEVFLPPAKQLTMGHILIPSSFLKINTARVS
jgi:hypothetical protein